MARRQQVIHGRATPHQIHHRYRNTVLPTSRKDLSAIARSAFSEESRKALEVDPIGLSERFDIAQIGLGKNGWIIQRLRRVFLLGPPNMLPRLEMHGIPHTLLFLAAVDFKCVSLRNRKPAILKGQA